MTADRGNDAGGENEIHGGGNFGVGDVTGGNGCVWGVYGGIWGRGATLDGLVYPSSTGLIIGIFSSGPRTSVSGRDGGHPSRGMAGGDGTGG